MTVIFDTIIVGGGIAGLQAAIQLGRSRRQVLVVDSGTGRSVIAKKYHNILGYPDGVSGLHLRSMGILQGKRVGVQYLADQVKQIRQDDQGLFQVSTGQQKAVHAGRTLILATGITDAIPAIPGLYDCLGESLYICPDCDGHEVIGQKAVVIGSGPEAAHLALRLTYYTQELTVVNHTKDKIGDDSMAQLSEAGISLLEEKVLRLEQQEGRLRAIHLESGQRLAMEKGFVAFHGAKVNTQLLSAFPLEKLPNGHILVDGRTRETSYRNIWAVGDVVAHSQMCTIAMGDGAQAAIWIHKRLFELTG